MESKEFPDSLTTTSFERNDIDKSQFRDLPFQQAAVYLYKMPLHITQDFLYWSFYFQSHFTLEIKPCGLGSRIRDVVTCNDLGNDDKCLSVYDGLLMMS